LAEGVLREGGERFQWNAGPSIGQAEKKLSELEERLSRKHEVLSELMEAHIVLKKSWGDLSAVWMPHDTRGAIVDFVRQWAQKTGIAVLRLVHWLKLAPSKFHDWKKRYGKVNLHKGWMPGDTWLEAWERETIERFYIEHGKQEYRRVTFMMLHRDVVAVSPSTVYRVLGDAGLLRRRNRVSTGRGKGFEQPESPHEHWLEDVSVSQHPWGLLLPLQRPGRT